jgi:hypothetical protein
MFILIVMAIYEMESWKVKPGKEHEHEVAMRNWMAWVKEHKDLFPEWKSLRYITKYIAGEETERHVMIWEYDSLASFEEYKARRKDYDGPYADYKKVDPYYMDVFDHTSMKVEVWKPQDRDLWIE